MPDASPVSSALLVAEAIGCDLGAGMLFSGLSFAVWPGLTLVRGGDGRGKTSLLRLMAGTRAPDTGRIQRTATSVWFEDLSDDPHDPVVARAWLAGRSARYPGWRAELATDLSEAFGLTEHLDKPLYMLSTGSRRKVGLVGAVASGAVLTLLDTPWAALDGRSRRVLDECLAEAVDSPDRAWVVADGVVPAVLEGLARVTRIDLGD